MSQRDAESFKSRSGEGNGDWLRLYSGENRDRLRSAAEVPVPVFASLCDLGMAGR
jgi:hypothetical protein